MKDKTNVEYKGIGFFEILTIVFIVLKLLHIIEWSWIWVLAPLWISLLIAAIMLLVAVFVANKRIK